MQDLPAIATMHDKMARRSPRDLARQLREKPAHARMRPGVVFGDQQRPLTRQQGPQSKTPFEGVAGRVMHHAWCKGAHVLHYFTIRSRMRQKGDTALAHTDYP